MELGALTAMTFGFRERELILDIFEMVTGLRMNHAYFRPGGVSQDLPPGAVDRIRDLLTLLPKRLSDTEKLLVGNKIWMQRTVGVGYLDLTGCMALGITGPVLRSTGLPHDLRKSQPYCGYETYDFEVQTWDTCDAYGRLRIRLNEMKESLKIVEQCLQRLEKLGPGPVMVGDNWDRMIVRMEEMKESSRIILQALDGLPEGPYITDDRKYVLPPRSELSTSMEALIHHFKLVTEGFRVPAGQVFQTVEHPRGELGVHLVSDGGTRPYRAHFRDPSFNNLQATSIMCEGGQVADVVVAVASLDPVLGGVDR